MPKCVSLALVATVLSACGALDLRGADQGLERAGDQAQPALPDFGPEGPPVADESGEPRLGLCGNGLDDDGDGLLDCDDPGCATVGSCCVGSADPACCTAPGPAEARSFGSCSGDLTACLEPPDELVGAEPPLLRHGALVARPSATASGVVLGPELDLRTLRVTLEADVRVPAVRCPDCLDAVALALGPTPPSSTSPVQPDLAVVVHHSAGELRVLARDDVVARFDLPSGDEATYALTVDPKGGAQVRRNDAVLLDGIALRPAAGRRVLVYGRNTGAGDDQAGVLAVRWRADGCDIPEALERPSSSAVPFPGPAWGSFEPSDPSGVLEDGGSVLLAFAAGGEIHLARRGQDGRLTLAGTGELDLPALVRPRGGLGAGGLAEPSLVRLEHRYALFVTALDRSGEPRLARALGAPAFGTTFGPLEALTMHGAADGLPLDGPSALALGGAVAALVARDRSEGGGRLLLLTAVDGDGLAFAPYGGSLESATLLAPRPDELDAFDRDEVADPDLRWGLDGVVRLAYAGRRGTSWGIGLAVGDQLGVLRRHPSVLLTPGGVGFDALGARSPSQVATPDERLLFYTALDGDELRIGAARGWTR